MSGATSFDEIFLAPKKSRHMVAVGNLPEASAVKQAKTNNCNSQVLEKRSKMLDEDEIVKPIPMRVKDDRKKRRTSGSFIPKKTPKY